MKPKPIVPNECIHINGLPALADEAFCHETLAQFGTIVAIKLLPAKDLTRDAIVRFSSTDEAKAMVDALPTSAPPEDPDALCANFVAKDTIPAPVEASTANQYEAATWSAEEEWSLAQEAWPATSGSALEEWSDGAWPAAPAAGNVEAAWETAAASEQEWAPAVAEESEWAEWEWAGQAAQAEVAQEGW